MKVIYSQKHYEWLVQAGIWPTTRWKGPEPRENIVGEMTLSFHEPVTVDWGINRIYREMVGSRPTLMPQTSFQHFRDNLEVLE